MALMVSGLLCAADPNPRFETLDLEDGLSQLSITASMQDQQGYLWFGTQSGLNRYDGYYVTVFKRDFKSEKSTLTDNFITALAQTPDAMIWIGTVTGGLNRFDPRTERVESWHADDGSGLDDNLVRALHVDGEGRLWVGTSGGLLLWTGSGFERPIEQLEGVTVTSIFTRESRLWAGTVDGLYVADTDNPESAHRLPGASGANVSAMVAYADSLWVGSNRGLFVFNESGELQRRLVHEAGDPHSLAFDQVESMLVDSSGTLWVGTTRGLSRYTPESQNFKNYYNDTRDEYSLTADRVSSILEDSTGILWFGTWTGGLSKFNPGSLYFQSFGVRDNLEHPKVRDFARDRDGSLLLATLGGGIYRYRPDTNALVRLDFDLPSKELQTLEFDHEGKLWIGTFDAGVMRLDMATGEVTHFPATGGGRGPQSSRILFMRFDHQQRLWIGTLDGGVSRYDVKSDTWRHFRYAKDNPNSLSMDSVGVIFIRSDGTVLLGTAGSGFCVYREATDDFIRHPVQPGVSGGLQHGSVYSFHEAPDGSLWLSTQGGGFAQIVGDIYGTPRFRFIDSGDGLPGDAIGAVLVDDDGRPWASTLYGISRVNADGSVSNFYPIHGTQSRGYYVASRTIMGDSLYFGGIEGITRFRPDNFSSDNLAPHTVLTQMLLLNQAVRPGDLTGVLPQSIGYTDAVQLRHEQNFFSIEFSGLHYADPSKNRYRYQLEGFDRQWIETDARRRYASYTNLNPGYYTFRVQSANRDGVWSEPAELAVHIQSPWWNTPGAYLAYIAAGILLALGIFVAWRSLRRSREEAAVAIRRSEERLKMGLWGSGDEMWRLDLKAGTLDRISHNNYYDHLFARPIRTDEEFFELCHEKDVERVKGAIQRHVRGDTPYFEAAYRILGKDGNWLWAMSRGRVTEFSAAGEPLAISGATKDVTKLKSTEQALRDLNDRLESMVDARTEDLQYANRELKSALSQLTEAQAQLVESEKMASLGALVAGIAHEVNTPIGVALTAATHMQNQARRIALDDDLSETLKKYLETHVRNCDFLVSNLNRAAELIRSFKQVAVDQSSEQIRDFRLREYFEEILTSLRPRLKRTAHTVEIDCDAELQLSSFPGALYQVITNLVMNSLTHAFPNGEAGTIRIEAELEGADRVRIRYCDNGVGFDDGVAQRIFEPFFTTRRGTGGSGLGMHIVYNLVTQGLGGKIRCWGKPGAGMTVEMVIPRSMR